MELMEYENGSFLEEVRIKVVIRLNSWPVLTGL